MWYRYWDQVLFEESCFDEESIRREIKTEKQIVGSFAFKHKMDFVSARTYLESKNMILYWPTHEIDTYLYQGGISDSDPGTKQLMEISELAQKAIEVFDRKRARKIFFPKAHLNHSVAGGWFGSPWDENFNFRRLSSEFNANQETFRMAGAGYGNVKPFYIQFGYKMPQLKLTSLEDCIEHFGCELANKEESDTLSVWYYHNNSRANVMATQNFEGKEIITFFREHDTFFEDYWPKDIGPKMHADLIEEVKKDSKRFKLTKQDKEILEYINKEVE